MIKHLVTVGRRNTLAQPSVVTGLGGGEGRKTKDTLWKRSIITNDEMQNTGSPPQPRPIAAQLREDSESPDPTLSN